MQGFDERDPRNRMKSIMMCLRTIPPSSSYMNIDILIVVLSNSVPDRKLDRIDKHILEHKGSDNIDHFEREKVDSVISGSDDISNRIVVLIFRESCRFT
jgi:hypothetical protein